MDIIMTPWTRGLTHLSRQLAAVAVRLVALALPLSVLPSIAPADDAVGNTSPDAQGRILAVAPAPGAEGIDGHAGIELRLASEPLADPLAETGWWRLSGSQTGLRTAEACELTIEPAADLGSYTLRLTPNLPFLPGEVVRLELRRNWPMADGRSLPGVFSTYRVAPRSAPARSTMLARMTGDRTESPSQLDVWSMFQDVQRIDVATGPNMAVAADFNRDGAVDLAVSEVLGDDSIDLFLNNGTGRMAFERSWQVEGLDDPGRFAARDLNGDGWIDLIILGRRSNNLAILTGGPELEFEVTHQVELDVASPLHVEVADIDLDGNQDVLVTHLGGDSITLLRGLPGAEGGFASAETIPALPGVQDLAVTHLDGNLQPDLALISKEQNTVAVLLGSEETLDPFRLQTSFAVPTGHRPNALATGDLNDDGHTDLIITEEGSNDIAIMTGRGDGTFEPPATYPVGDRPVTPALADLDGDGHLDIAVPNLFSDEITLLLGAGDGTVRAIHDLPVDPGPVSIAAADFDGDGDIDLAVVNSVADNVTLYANQRSESSLVAQADEPRSLAQNVPNPFNPATTITFTLLEPSSVNLVVFNTSGTVVRTLVDELRQAGQHSSYWDGTNERGEKVPSGIYFYRLTTDDTVELRRMTLLR